MKKRGKRYSKITKRAAACCLAAAMILSSISGYGVLGKVSAAESFAAIPQNETSAAYYPSQYSGNPISNIFDGNDSTFWETNWGPGTASFKSGDYFIIDLEKSRENVSRISYAPRQDSQNGRIKEYEIYTSNAASLSGNGLEANGFELAGKGTWDTDTSVKTGTFNSKTAKYIAVKVYSVGGDGATITCGEFGVYTGKDVVVDPQAAYDKIEEVKGIIDSSDSEVLVKKLQEVLDRVEADMANYTQEGIEAVVNELDKAVETYGAIGNVDTIYPGQVWLDNNGVPIQAHGSNIIYVEETKTYYWYGEHKGADNISTGAETGTPAIGISCYSSKDLYNWTNEGVALPVFNNPQLMDGTGNDDTPMYLSEKSDEYKNSSLPKFGGSSQTNGAMKSPVDSLSQFNTEEYINELNVLYTDMSLSEKQEFYNEFNWNRVVERPKVVYNKNTDKYVMWWHQDGPTVGRYTMASAGVAVGDSPTGPFKYLDTFRMPNRGNPYGSGGDGMLRDMTLFADDDGTGYLIYASEDNATTIIYKLNEEYTQPSGNVEGRDYVRAFIGGFREAPAVFKDGDTYYMITSGQTGWNPNPCKYAYSTSGIMGSWSNTEYFCQDDFTLNNQPAGSPANGTTYRSQSTNILPVRDWEGNIVQGKFIYMGDRWFSADLKDSRYIWLPINLDSSTNTLTMSWKDSWSIEEEFDLPKPEITEVETLDPITVEYGTAFEALTLPKKVNITYGAGISLKLGVTWLQEGYNPETAGEYTLTGTLESSTKFENPQNMQAAIKVIVKDKEVQTGVNPTPVPSDPYDAAVKNVPAKVKLKSVKKKGKKIKVTWKKVTEADGYQIAAANKKGGKYKVKLTVKAPKTKGFVKKLSSKKKKLFIKVRAYRLDGKEKVYGKYSAAKKVKL